MRSPGCEHPFMVNNIASAIKMIGLFMISPYFFYVLKHKKIICNLAVIALRRKTHSFAPPVFTGFALFDQ